MRCLAFIILFWMSSISFALPSNPVSKVDFERLFYGDIIKPQNYIKPIGMALIGNFSGAILENEKNEQFFVVQGDEINIENQIFYKVPNNTSGLEVESEKSQLILFLRNKLKNKVNLTIEIDKTIDKKLAYTNKDKYDILRKKNPLIEEFRKSLGLSV